jgi:hypothetical protein
MEVKLCQVARLFRNNMVPLCGPYSYGFIVWCHSNFLLGFCFLGFFIVVFQNPIPIVKFTERSIFDELKKGLSVCMCILFRSKRGPVQFSSTWKYRNSVQHTYIPTSIHPYATLKS